MFDPPVLAIYGSSDTMVPVRDAQILAERMMAAGARVSILVVPQARHDFYQLASPGTDYPVWSFLDLHLKPR